MTKLTAEERRRDHRRRQSAAQSWERRRSTQAPTPSRSARWAVIGIIGLALSFMAASAASHVVPPLSFRATTSLLEWLMPQRP